MIRSLTLTCFVALNFLVSANPIIVKNIIELNEANKKAIPGDIIILQNGQWNDVTIKLHCNGTKEKPITFKAQTAGKVLITGNSKLKIGGQYIIVEGLYFINGYSGKDDVIDFRIDNKELANNCRVTNTVIDDFNNPKRVDENNWVSLYGKNNRLDHCSFINKKNFGVLLAVLLDDDRSRENFHSIDHNYFGKRLPLASNGGEIIRVGLSQHCQYNSNTQIKNNFFEACDGEAEIISIKSCSNVIEANVFSESQGAVVLRHGDNNLVAGNYFFGNDKPGTGGVRVINKGQKIINNTFYKCRGVDFRSPLVIMNGVPNSPPTRYVQVTNAEITGNSFYECSPLSFCEGSDAERTLPPENVLFSNNTFYNTRDSNIYNAYDNIKGINFENNKVSMNVSQYLGNGFEKTAIPGQKNFSQKELFKASSAYWYKKNKSVAGKKPVVINCVDANDVYKQIENKEAVIIRLTGKKYSFHKPMIISKNTRFTSDKTEINFASDKLSSVFIVTGNGSLTLSDLNILGADIKADHFISSDSTGPSEHYNLTILNCVIKNIDRQNGCSDIFHAFRSMVADSIVIRGTEFIDNHCDILNIKDEKDDKGYYNAETIFVGHNKFIDHLGSLLNIYRGGTDESTLGPDLSFSHNKIENCNAAENNGALITLTGVQATNIFSNHFINCNRGAILIAYYDKVRAKHNFQGNDLSNSGKLMTNNFVIEKNNKVR